MDTEGSQEAQKHPSLDSLPVSAARACNLISLVLKGMVARRAFGEVSVGALTENGAKRQMFEEDFGDKPVLGDREAFNGGGLV